MSTTMTPLTQQILVSIYVRRDIHENGMTLKEYADEVIAGIKPTLSHDEYVYQFGSVQDEITLVEEWATSNNLSIVESGAGIGTVKVYGTIEIFNNLFNIISQTVIEDTGRTYITHAGTLTIPPGIDHVVQAILGLDNSIQLTNNAILDENVSTPIAPNIIVSPDILPIAVAYKFPRAVGSDQIQGKGACVAILSMSGGYTTANLTSTFSRIGLANPTVVDVSVDGGTNNVNYDPSGGNVENMLDIYCVGAIVPSAKIAFYSAPNTFASFVNVINAMANDVINNPSVISISWGALETYWGSYIGTLDSAIQSAVVKGITTFVASGDYGIRAQSGSPLWTVQLPAASAYCVAAGGTVLTLNDDYSILYEIAWGTSSIYAGGGGKSELFSLPAWQTGCSTTTTPSPTTAPLTVRGIPDVSANATYYYIYYGPSNLFASASGTSASAPLLAGLMARLNQLTSRRIGFVNADWYGARTTAFYDTTSGNNMGNNVSGYQATSGWDGCTGLGSPIGTELYKLVNIGETFPKCNYGFRPPRAVGGQTYPRISTGLRIS